MDTNVAKWAILVAILEAISVVLVAIIDASMYKHASIR
jgi:hypothetical protein